MSYKERLVYAIYMQPLELRHLHFDVIFYYNILNNQSSIDKAGFFNFHAIAPLDPSRHPCTQLFHPKAYRHATNRLLSSFCYRSVDCWKSLSLDIKNGSVVFHVWLDSLFYSAGWFQRYFLRYCFCRQVDLKCLLFLL